MTQNQSDRRLFLESDRIAHLFRNHNSLTPFDQAVSYTMIDFNRATNKDDQCFPEKARVVASKITEELEQARSVVFAIEPNGSTDVSGSLWLCSLYLTVWFAEKHKTTSL